MSRFLENFSIDRFSFWLGFLAGILVWWIIGRSRPWLSQQFKLAHQKIKTIRDNITASTDIRLRNDIIRHSERLHLASPLFSLSEIIILPRLLAPPAIVEPGKSPPPEDIAAQTVPFLPDWPEIAAVYQAPTFTLAEALQGNANLVLTGHPGSGKTVALAHLAFQLAKQETLPGNLNRYIPLLIHAADLIFPAQITDNLFEPLTRAISIYASGQTQTKLPSYLATIFLNGQALLLLDGLDELPVDSIQPIVDYLKKLLEKFPHTRVVTTAGPDQYDGLLPLGFIPVPLAVWGTNQKSEFLERWSSLWNRYVEQPGAQTEPVDVVLINSWLVSDRLPNSPMEFTLKVWAVYAGDILGQKLVDSLEAYIRRMTHGIDGARQGLENLAFQAIYSQSPFFSQKDARGWVSEFDKMVQPANGTIEEDPQQPDTVVQEQRSEVTSPISRILSALTDNGLVQPRLDSRMGLIHPMVLSYLAGRSMASNTQKIASDLQLTWTTSAHAAGFMAAQQSESPIVDLVLQANKEPLYKELLMVGRWLSFTQDNIQWRSTVMRQLATVLQNEANPQGLRARAMAALAVAGISGVGVLFRQLMTSHQPDQRQITALGCGYLRDIKVVDDLNNLMSDPISGVHCAASLALVAIGNKQSLEYVADALLGGDDEIRRSAAEALANNTEEGYPTLKEGSELDDVLVRKAVIFGLQRIQQPWAAQIIEKLYVGDDQWVVKDAASQALREMALANARIPKPYPPTYNLPWLIAFGGERGIGVAPGKAAWDLLMLVLREGSEEQRIAAMNYLAYQGESSVIVPLYHILYSDADNLSEAAYQAIWYLAASGIETPSPTQFGLGFSD